MLSGWKTELAEQISLSGNSQIEEKNWFAESKQKALEESLVAKKAEIKKIREDSAKLKKKQNYSSSFLFSLSINNWMMIIINLNVYKNVYN